MSITVNILGEAVQLSGNPVRVELTGALAPAGSTGYKLLLRVFSPDGKLFGAPFTDDKYPDFYGKAMFDISGYVDQPVDYSFQYPISGVMVEHPTKAYNITVQSGESYYDSNGDYQEDWGVPTAVFQMLKGGNSIRQLAMMNDDGSNFYDDYIDGSQWLTPRPQGDLVHPTQFVKLWYMEASSRSPLFIIETVYDDGSKDTFSESVTMNPDYLYEFNCNPAYHGVDLEPSGKKAVYFEVFLDYGVPGYSQKRQFYFDWRHIERPYFFFAANSLGGIDDYYFSGNNTDSFVTEGNVATYPAQPGDSVFVATQRVSSRIGWNEWSVNTGWKPLTTMQYYRYLLISTQAWYLYSNKTQTTFSVIPIVVKNGSKPIFNRKEDMFHIDIDYYEAHKSSFNHDNRRY